MEGNMKALGLALLLTPAAVLFASQQGSFVYDNYAAFFTASAAALVLGVLVFRHAERKSIS